MDYSKQKQINTNQDQEITNLKNEIPKHIAAIKTEMNTGLAEEQKLMEKEIAELKEKITEHDNQTDRKLDELYNWRIEASKGQARIETTLNMLEKNMLSQFENLNKKLDMRS